MPGTPIRRARREALGIPPTGTGNGWGWGGPAKGPGQQGPGNSGGRRPRAMEAAKRDQHAEHMLALSEHLAFNAESQMLQVKAADAELDRLIGKPVSRSVMLKASSMASPTDGELAQRIAEVGDAIARAE